MENNKQYCILCGAENKLTDKFCHKCGESLDQKDDQLQSYAKEKVKEKITDEVKGKATDGLLEMLKKFLNSKAYGIILSLSVVAGVGSALVGGSGVKEFSNSVPGMFSDGQVYGMNFSGQQNLFYYHMGAYPGYDEAGNMTILYLDGRARSDGSHIDLKVTGADGKTIIDKRIMSEYGSSERFCYAVDDMGATIEIRPENTEGGEDYLIVQLGTANGIRCYEEYEDGDLIKMQEFYDNGVMKYQYFKTLVVYADHGRIFGKEETFRDEQDRITLSERVNSVESERWEYTYYDNGTYYRLHQQNGLNADELTYDSQDRVIIRKMYQPAGTLLYTEEMTYYDNGMEKSKASYGLGDDAEDMLSRYEEYYEEGSMKLYQKYYDGVLGDETVRNADGTGQYISYDTMDDSHYITSVTDFVEQANGNTKYIREVQYYADGSIRAEYTYDENNNRIAVN